MTTTEFEQQVLAVLKKNNYPTSSDLNQLATKIDNLQNELKSYVKEDELNKSFFDLLENQANQQDQINRFKETVKNSNTYFDDKCNATANYMYSMDHKIDVIKTFGSYVNSLLQEMTNVFYNARSGLKNMAADENSVENSISAMPGLAKNINDNTQQ